MGEIGKTLMLAKKHIFPQLKYLVTNTFPECEREPHTFFPNGRKKV